MLRTLRPLLIATLLAALAACAQPLNSTVASVPDSPVPSSGTVANTQANTFFTDQTPKEGGWKGLANLLEAMVPSIDTSIPLSPSQITDRIATLLDQGNNLEALDIIEKREQQLQSQVAPGADVQLMFLHARALAGLNRHNQAIAMYQKMTILYPELPEPWNNLAAEYVKQGKLDMARDALTMALTADPHYSTARTNLSDVLQQQAQQLLQ